MSTSFLPEDMIRYYEDMWIGEQLKILSNDKYSRLLKRRTLGETTKSFWQIIQNEKWDSINFHFELKLTGETPLCQTSKEIEVLVHLESQHIDKNTDKKARAFFINNGALFKSKNKIDEVCGMKLEGSFIPDFSSEETAKKTILEIIDILNSDPYQKCAKIANAFIRELSNE